MHDQLYSQRPRLPSAVVSDKHIIFGLAGEIYSLPILQIQEIIAKYRITVLPGLPDYFRGVMALRGSAIPIINLRRRLELPEREMDSRTRIIVVDLQPNLLGIQVDEVLHVATIRAGEIEAAPALAGGRSVPYIRGVSELFGDKLIIHLDMAKALGSEVPFAEISASLRDYYRTDRRKTDAPEQAVPPAAGEPQPAAA